MPSCHQNTLFSVKTFKTLCYQDGCSIPNTLNWEELSVKILNCAILMNFFALFPDKMLTFQIFSENFNDKNDLSKVVDLDLKCPASLIELQNKNSEMTLKCF